MSRSREEGATSRGALEYGNDARPALTTNDALLYLREVKQRFHHRKDVYDTFLDIMKDFKSQTIDIACVINKVKSLLRGHEDLILGFNTFLPKGSEITTEELRIEEPASSSAQMKPAAELDHAIAYINKIKTRFVEDSTVYKNFLEILCAFRQGRMNIKAVYQEVADLFQHHEDLLVEFSYFLPERTKDAGLYGSEYFSMARPLGPLSSNSNDPYNETRRRRIEANRRLRDFECELGFFDEVKSKLNNREAYNDLLKCINLYAQDIISKSELVGLVSDVIGRFPDVMSTFREFLASIPGDDEAGHDPRNGGREPIRGGLAHFQRSRAMIQQRNKYLTRPVSELDTSDLDRPTTSYILLPSDYPSMSCSGKTVLGREVLQDAVASVTTGTEDGSFKHMRKNQYEEALFRAEDERYDLELAIDRNRSTIQALIPVQEYIDSLNPDERAAYTLPLNTLRSFHIRTIEKIYGEKGRSVYELLKKNPVVSVPVVLCRLQQKNEEWMGVLNTMNVHWQNIADANYHKSLDHRSFYFKQQDKKNLAPKTLLQELKDAMELTKSDQKLTSLSGGVPVNSLFLPHLQFSFDDVEVHEDLFNIVRFAASKMLPPNVWKQSMEIWTEFIEPFFHLTPHVLDVDLMELDGAGSEAEAEVEEEMPETNPLTNAIQEEEELPKSDTATAAANTEEEDIVMKVETVGEMVEPMVPSMAMEDEDEEESDKDRLNVQEENKKNMLMQEADPSQGYRRWSQGLDVMFCNEAFYLFLRYHEILYHRIKLARSCCREHNLTSNDDEGGCNSAGDGGPDMVMTLDQETSEKRHGQFMSLVYALIDSSIDIAQFEDQCRSLLSTNSYVLFTLDKLIVRLVKQLQTLVFDEPSKQVWQLYKYEASRSSHCHEGVYYANTKTVVREDYLVRAQSHPLRTLTLTYVDNSFVYDLPNGNAKFNHGEYSKIFMDSTSNRKQSELGKVFLSRNKDLVHNRRHYDNDDNDNQIERKGVMDNGLEMKISIDDHKLKFIEGTADIWWTLPQDNYHRRNNYKELRKQTFRRWVHGKLLGVVVSPPETIEALMSSKSSAL